MSGFEGLIGGWSAWMGKKGRFLLVFLGIFHIDFIAHNPEVAESVDTPTACRRNSLKILNPPMRFPHWEQY